MSVNQRTLADLKKECQDLGIVVQFPIAKNGKVKENKRDLILALRSHYLKAKYPNGAPKNLQVILSLESLMLCDRLHEKTEQMQKEIVGSPNWGWQEKMNGCRMVMIFHKGEGMSFYSRGVSVTDYLPVEYTNIWLGEQPKDGIEHWLGQHFDSFALDCEVISTNSKISTVLEGKGVLTESMLQAVSALLALNDADSLAVQKEAGCPLKFLAFDCFYLNGELLDEDHKALKQTDREKVSRTIVNVMKAASVNLSHLDTVYDPALKQKFYNDILAAGGEGAVAKHKDALYRAVEARSRNLWVKMKRSVAGSLTATPYGDTIDAFVTGFDLGEEGKGYENLVGSLTFSVWVIKADGTREQHEIARISAIPLEQRKQITVLDGAGKPVLVESMYNKVAEIDGQAISSRAMRLTHSRLLSWRTDKSPEQCEMHEDFLKQMVL